MIKKLVDDYIDKIYKDYELLRTHTTRELLEIDKELAVLKYALSMQRLSEELSEEEMEDKYVIMAIYRHYPDKAFITKWKKQFEEALKRNDQLLDAKLTKEKPKSINKDSVMKVGAGVVGVGMAMGVGALYIKKKENTKEGVMIMKELIWNDLTKEMVQKALEIERTKTLAIIFLLGFCFGFVFPKQATIFLVAFGALIYLLFTTYSEIKQNLTQEKQSST